jgi:predicted short-subunit dehydrogenase-like oxidoreductase (DUF2520 family)
MGREIENMVVIGSGNVAWHIIHAFQAAGVRVVQVLARNKQSARHFSRHFNIPYTLNVRELNRQADIYILAVKDDQIPDTASALRLEDQLLVHTSGFTPMDALKDFSREYGVLWPLQTLTAEKEVSYSEIPFLLEANSKENEERLMELAKQVSENVMVTDSQVRQRIHLAAVIASNLTNHLYAISAAILDRQDIPFSVLAPLIRETAAKAAGSHPLASQTGPAARKDMKVIRQHLDLLRDEPTFYDIYKLISENIIHHHD